MKPTASQYARALFELSHKGSVSEQAGQFLSFLKRQRGTKKLPAIVRNLQRLTDEAEGVKRVRMTTSKPLDEKSMEALTKKIKKLLDNEKLILDSKVDAYILGGVALKTDTELFDGTVRKRLGELRRALE